MTHRNPRPGHAHGFPAIGNQPQQIKRRALTMLKAFNLELETERKEQNEIRLEQLLGDISDQTRGRMGP